MRLLIVGSALLSSLLLVGCRQGEGDRCQVQADCEDGLICQLPVQGSPQSGGVCNRPGSVSTDLAVETPSDMSPDVDM
jgi:hypothetical protein